MAKELVHTRTCVYNINYHVVWSVKYRRAIMDARVEEDLKIWAQEIAAEHGFIVHLFECGDGNHVHCFLSAPPKVAPAYMVKCLKAITARRLFEKYPRLRAKLRKGHIWNPSYYIETVGSVSEENIRRYIAQQKKVR